MEGDLLKHHSILNTVMEGRIVKVVKVMVQDTVMEGRVVKVVQLMILDTGKQGMILDSFMKGKIVKVFQLMIFDTVQVIVIDNSPLGRIFKVFKVINTIKNVCHSFFTEKIHFHT